MDKGTVSGGVRVVAIAGGRAACDRLARLRHVLWLYRALDDPQRAVLADGRDETLHPQILAAEYLARVDGAADLVEPGLDGLGFRVKFLGPLVVIHLREFSLVRFQPVDLGLFLIGRRRGFAFDAGVAGVVAPFDLDHGAGPLPAGCQLVGGCPQPVGGELLQQHRVLEPDTALVVRGEDVAQHLAARDLVGFDRDEAGDGGRTGRVLLGQGPLHLPGLELATLVGDLFPDRHLALPVDSDVESPQHLQVDRVGPVGVQPFRSGIAEAEPRFEQPFRQAEKRGGGGHRLAGIDWLREGDDLVGRVHGNADDILGERDTGNRVVGFLTGQRACCRP